eukprot:scaffold21810_cov41-Attheya_sp.AAC.1
MWSSASALLSLATALSFQTDGMQCRDVILCVYSRLTVKILDRHARDLAATEHHLLLSFCEPHLNDSMYGNSRRTKCPISFFDSLLCLRHDYVSMTLTRSSIRLSHQTKAEVSRSQIPDHGIA